MDCKNCKSELIPQNNFCSDCGAKIISERITVKRLLFSVFVTLGWDSNFFVTLRHLMYKPHIVFKEYIDGTRKKYANPFTFFAISVAISLFVINQYSEQFNQMATLSDLQQEEEKVESDSKPENEGFRLMGFESQEELNESIALFTLKYYNQLSFLYFKTRVLRCRLSRFKCSTHSQII